jgi:septal ring-binding cell division protein DamX
MANIRRTARGDKVDIDMIALANEKTIAVGNAKTNARGDQLGPGGKVVKTRAQLMAEYHKLNAPVPDNTPPVSSAKALKKQLLTPEHNVEPAPVASAVDDAAEVMATTEPVAEVPTETKPRGSFAESVKDATDVKQELMDPPSKKTSDGISRI